MTLVVPFDGSELSEAALVRASEFRDAFDERVLAVSVIPQRNASYARDRGWIGAEEEFDLREIVGTLHERVADLCPTADFRHVLVDRYATAGSIARRVRTVAREEDASMVFIGSENAGSVVTSVSSVGGSISAGEAYDVVIVRTPRPEEVTRREATGSDHAMDDFAPPE